MPASQNTLLLNCTKDPAKKRLCIKVAIGVSVGILLLIIIIVVATVVSQDGGDDEPDTQTQGMVTTRQNASFTSQQAVSTQPVTTRTTPTTTEPDPRTVIQAQFRIRVSSDSTTTSPPETLAVHDETQTQVVYYETPFYDVYILQRFAEGEKTQTLVGLFSDNLADDTRGSVLFCYETRLNGEFVASNQIQNSKKENQYIISGATVNISTETLTGNFNTLSVIIPLFSRKCSDLNPNVFFSTGTEATTNRCATYSNETSNVCEDPICRVNECPPDQRTLSDSCSRYDQCNYCEKAGDRSSGREDLSSHCSCRRHLVEDLDLVTCLGDSTCSDDNEAIVAEQRGASCICDYSIRAAYPCGLEGPACEDSSCTNTLKWCFDGFRLAAPAKFYRQCSEE